MLLLALACSPYAAWPDPAEVFPAVYTPEADLLPYEEVRFETETWTPEDDPDQLALYVQKSILHRLGAPVESLDHFAAMRPTLPPLGAGKRVSFAGDVMWVGDNWSAFATPAAGLLDGDLRVANLETPVSASASTEPGELGLYAFNAPDAVLDALPFDVLQLTNNHALDAGPAGIGETVAAVEAHGYAHTGVDTVATVDGVALLAFTWGLNVRDVDPGHDLHVVPFGHLDAPVDLTPVEAAIATARAGGAESVVVLVHWGYEYEYYPDPHFQVLARAIVAAGADVVVGQGPHVVQPAELCFVNHPEVVPGVGTCSVRSEDGRARVAAVLYSLGDFGTGLPTAPCEVGIVATVSLDPDVTGLGWAAEVTVAGPSVVPLADALADPEGADPDLVAEDERLRAHLGAGWER